MHSISIALKLQQQTSPHCFDDRRSPLEFVTVPWMMLRGHSTSHKRKRPRGMWNHNRPVGTLNYNTCISLLKHNKLNTHCIGIVKKNILEQCSRAAVQKPIGKRQKKTSRKPNKPARRGRQWTDAYRVVLTTITIIKTAAITRATRTRIYKRTPAYSDNVISSL